MLDHLHHMLAGVDFRVVLFWLWHAKQLLNLGQQHAQRTAVVQGAEVHIGAFFHQRAGGFFPHAFGSQGLQFAALGQLAHQL